MLRVTMTHAQCPRPLIAFTLAEDWIFHTATDLRLCDIDLSRTVVAADGILRPLRQLTTSLN